MLEDEVTERVQQLRERQRDLLDLLGTLPDGVVVIEEGGRVVLSSPVAEKWLTRELRMAGQPIQRFIETAHDEWAENETQVEIGEHTLRLTAADLPTEGEEKKRKVVVIHRVEETPAGISPQLSDPLTRVKGGLVWLYQQKIGTAILDVVKHLAVQISEMERLSGKSDGENGRSDQLQTVERPEPPIGVPVADKVETPIGAPNVDQVGPTIEAAVTDHVEAPSEVAVPEEVIPPIESPAADVAGPPIEAPAADVVDPPSEPQIDIYERPPSQPQEVEKVDLEAALTPENAVQSGMLRKHLDTKPPEKFEALAEEVQDEGQTITETNDALETLEEIIDEEISAQGAEDQLAVGEDFFENLEKELAFDGTEDEIAVGDTPAEEPVPLPQPQRSKEKDSSWPPRRPSEMNDFDEYK